MNRTRLLIAGLLALACVIVTLTFWPSRPQPAAAQKEAAAAPSEKRKPVSSKPGASAERVKKQVLSASSAKPKTEEAVAGAVKQAEPASEGAAAAASEVKLPREKAVAAWEALVDRVIEQKNVPPNEQAPAVKEAFDKLDKEDQMSGIHQALNLFPDEQFPALYAILFDKAENAEVLDAIFSDALNRPEELKNPLMKELVKDKEHPCFFESARILDVIGELQVKPAPTPSP